MLPPRLLPILTATAALALASTLAGCGSGGPAGSASPAGNASPSGGQPLRVVAAFYPLAYLAEQVGGDAVQVAILTPPGAEPHDLELSPQQVAEVAQADLVLYIPGFQPALDEAVQQQASDHAVDVTTGLTLLPATADEAEHDGEADHAGEGAFDPHVWLNPTNMAVMGDTVATRLAEQDPDVGDTVTAGADRLRATMTALDARWSEGTATCTSRDLVVSHLAFGYLAQQYDFHQIGISGLSPEAEPSPAQVAEVARFVRENGVTTIYYETLVDPKVAQAVAQETGATAAVLDPLEGLPEGSTEDYVSVMDTNLQTVRAGQGCS